MGVYSVLLLFLIVLTALSVAKYKAYGFIFYMLIALMIVVASELIEVVLGYHPVT